MEHMHALTVVCCTCRMQTMFTHSTHLIHPCAQENEHGWPRVLNIWFEHNNTVAKADLVEWIDSVTIDKTGMYYLWFVVCERELNAVQVGVQCHSAGGWVGCDVADYRRVWVVVGSMFLLTRVCVHGFVVKHFSVLHAQTKPQCVPPTSGCW